MANPVCAIVGAGEGLGQSLAAKFAAEGFDLALLSRSEAGSAACCTMRARNDFDATVGHAATGQVRASHDRRGEGEEGCGYRCSILKVSTTTRRFATLGKVLDTGWIDLQAVGIAHQHIHLWDHRSLSEGYRHHPWRPDYGPRYVLDPP